MRGVYILVAVLCGLLALTKASAAESTNATGKRFLFIVETSSATRSGAANAQKLLSTLIESGMGGLMETGDTYGLWTFNEQLYAGQLPMQRWAIESAREQAQQIGELLKKQKFQKEPQMEPVLRPMYSVIRNSPTITVVLVTSGKKPMQGTPFDRDINEFYKEHFRDFQKQKTPFVTMLLAQEGEVLRHSVSAALGDVKIPKPLPPKPAPVKEYKHESKAPASGASTNKIASAKPLDKPPVTNATKALVITKSGAQTVEGKAVAELPAPKPKPAEEPKPTAAAISAPGGSAVSTNIPTAALGDSPVANASTNGNQNAEAVAPASLPSEPKAVVETKPSVPPQPMEPIKNIAQPIAAAAVPPAGSNAVASVEQKPKPAVPAPTNSLVTAAAGSPEKAAPAAAIVPTNAATAQAAADPAPVIATPAATRKPGLPAVPATVETRVPQPIPLAQPQQNEPTSISTTQTIATAQVRQPPASPRPAVKPKVYLVVGSTLVLVAVVIAFFIGRHTNRKPERSLISDWANQNSAK